MIIETCPKCGHDLQDEVICTYPPIPRKVCWNCGWSWTGKPEKIIRVPFGSNTNNFTDKDNTSIRWNGPSIDWDSTNLDTSININAFSREACENCPCNPKNGGDGVCFCILGQQNIVY